MEKRRPANLSEVTRLLRILTVEMAANRDATMILAVDMAMVVKAMMEILEVLKPARKKPTGQPAGKYEIPRAGDNCGRRVVKKVVGINT